MKKLAILTNENPPYRRAVFNGLARDYDVTVLHAGPPAGTVDDRYAEVIVPVRRCGPLTLAGGLRRGFAERFDAVLAMFDLTWPSYLAPLLRARRRGRWVLWGIGYGRSGIDRPIRDWLVGRADAVLLYGGADAQRMIDRGIDARKIFVAENTVHVTNSRDCSAQPKNSLLYVGRLIADKRIDALLDAFDGVAGRVPAGTRLDIVGDGPERSALAARARALKSGKRIVFHGDVRSDDALVDFFSRAYAYVTTGRIGLGALHSFAYGVPVITRGQGFHGPESRNLEAGRNALLYRNRAELEQALVDVCTRPGLAAALGRSGYRFYSRERTLEVMLGGFRQAIEGVRPDGGSGGGGGSHAERHEERCDSAE